MTKSIRDNILYAVVAGCILLGASCLYETSVAVAGLKTHETDIIAVEGRLNKRLDRIDNRIITLQRWVYNLEVE